MSRRRPAGRSVLGRGARRRLDRRVPGGRAATLEERRQRQAELVRVDAFQAHDADAALAQDGDQLQYLGLGEGSAPQGPE